MAPRVGDKNQSVKMARWVGDKNESVKMARWVGDKNEYNRWQRNSMAVCIIIWLFLYEYYMNSMVVVVFYDSNYTKLYYVLLWAMAFIQS